MKRLFFFIIMTSWVHYSMCADSNVKQEKKSPICATPSQALDAWWNEDTGKVSENFIRTAHQKQEAREDIFHCDISSCKRRDIRRAILVIGMVSAVGVVAMPHLAIPIASYGLISTAALGLPLIVYSSPDDPRKKLD